MNQHPARIVPPASALPRLLCGTLLALLLSNVLVTARPACAQEAIDIGLEPPTQEEPEVLTGLPAEAPRIEVVPPPDAGEPDVFVELGDGRTLFGEWSELSATTLSVIPRPEPARQQLADLLQEAPATYQSVTEPTQVSLDDVWWLRREAREPRLPWTGPLRGSSTVSAASPQIWMTNGDCLLASPLRLENEGLVVHWHNFRARPPWRVPLEQARLVVFQGPQTRAEWQRILVASHDTEAGGDLAILENGDTVRGEWTGLDETWVSFGAGNALQRLDRQRVIAVRIDPELTIEPARPTRYAQVRLTDGTTASVTGLRRAAEAPELQFELAWGEAISLGIDALQDVWFVSPRLTPLAAQPPTALEMTPFLSRRWPLQTDRNVQGGPLSVGGIASPSGLGMHTRTRATYAIPPGAKLFRTGVGVDDWSNGLGSVEFRIEADGTAVWTSPVITPADGLVLTPWIDLSGRQQLTLIADYGTQADVADYADWLAPVFRFDPPVATPRAK